MNWVQKGFRANDWVEVKSAHEILDTLDDNGDLHGLPFMPEMLAYCGRRFRVLKSAHKTCDTVNQYGNGRRMHDAVHLDALRCDGSAHDGCQANCLLFWKTVWLRPVDGPSTRPIDSSRGEYISEPPEIGVAHLRSGCAQREPNGDPVYRCQATQILEATQLLRPSQFSQYVADVHSRNVRPSEAIKVLFLRSVHRLRDLGIGYRAAVRMYEVAHRILRRRPAPRWEYAIKRGERTPNERLNLQVGEEVEVKNFDEILATLDSGSRNRGLSFDAEMAYYCGRRFRVAARIEKIINEKTRRMMHFKNPCIALDGAVCKALYSPKRLMCPRQITPYWREIWLRRVEPSPTQRSGEAS